MPVISTFEESGNRVVASSLDTMPTFKCLHSLDVFGAGSLGTTAFPVRDLFSFAKSVKFDTLKTLGMEEQVFIRRCLDESEAFVRQFLDRAFWHVLAFQLND